MTGSLIGIGSAARASASVSAPHTISRVGGAEDAELQLADRNDRYGHALG
jgi:hypothetical protein